MNKVWFAVPVAAVGTLLFATWHNAKPGPAPAEVIAAAKPRYTVADARWSRYDADGRLSFEAKAKTIDVFNDQSARLNQLELRGLGGAGSPWRIEAPQGYAPAKGSRLRLSGPVIGDGRWPEGEALRFTAPELWVDQDKHEISTESEIKVDSPHRKAEAIGFRADWAGKHVQLLRDVKVSYARGG